MANIIIENKNIYLIGILEIEYFKTIFKEFEGQMFQRRELVKEEIILNKSENLLFSFEFKELDLKYNIFCDNSFFTKNYFEIFLNNFYFSENTEVNIIRYLFENKFLDSRIIDIKTSRYEPTQNYLKNWKQLRNFINQSKIYFNIYRYTNQDYLQYSLNWETICFLEKNKIEKIVKAIPFLKSKNTLEKSFKLLNLKIKNYATS